MRFIDISLASDLPEDWKARESRIRTDLAKLDWPDSQQYVRDHSAWGVLKPWLENLSYKKCWYCEAKSPRAPFDVDHFRPKLAVTVDNVTVEGHSGYWWLAYVWENYRLSCQRCNRPSTDHSGARSGKRNEFPLRDERLRAPDPDHSIDLEEPRLLDPCVESDTALLEHFMDGEVRPRGVEPEWDWQRAHYTIIRLGLSDPRVAEEKRERWQDLLQLLKCVDQGLVPSDGVAKRLKRALEPNAEYSSFFRAAISTHRDKEWIEALL